MFSDLKKFIRSLRPKAPISTGDLWSYWITHAETLRWCIVALCITNILTGAGALWALNRQPLVIRVDDVGNAAVIRDLKTNNMAMEVEIRAFAKDFLRSYLQISSITVKNDLARALNMMSKRMQKDHINELRSTKFLARLIRANISTRFDIRKMAITSDSNSRIYLDVRGISTTRPLEDSAAPASQKGIIANLVLIRVPRTEQSPHGLLVEDFRRETRPLQEILGKERVYPCL